MPHSKQQYLLLDSCIIEYLLDEHMHNSVSTQLNQWYADIFKPAISEVTYSELIDGAKADKETKVIKLLDGFYSFPLTKRIVKGSGILGSLYKEESQELKDVCLADKLIAMTSAVYNTPIVTANIRDYPPPFFHNFTDENIMFEKKGKQRMINIGVMSANYPYITHKFNNRK